MAAIEPARRAHRRGFVFWLGRAALALVLLLIAMLGAGAVYQQVGSSEDARRYPPPGELVDVGGHSLHLNCTGAGSPTVILDHLGDGNSAEWALVQPELATTNRVCAYDRAGFAWSEPGPLPRTGGRSADELRAALENAGIGGPYVLVGHSYGADVMVLFADRNAGLAAGLVLVDPGIYDSPELPAELSTNQDDSFMRIAAALAPVGLMRLSDSLGVDGVTTGDLSAEQAAVYRAMRQKNGFWDLLLDVSAGMPETSAELRAVTSLGDLPIIVLNADQPDDSYRRAWTEFNRRSASLSTRGEFRMVPGANHASIVNSKEYAEQVVQAVRDVMAR